MGFHEAFNIRVDELQVLSMEFLYDCPRPTVALLYHDNKDVRHLRTYEISLKDKVPPTMYFLLHISCSLSDVTTPTGANAAIVNAKAGFVLGVCCPLSCAQCLTLCMWTTQRSTGRLA